VDSEKWGALNGSLLNLSYGYGTIYVIPHEKVGNQMQGGIFQLPIPAFKTGLIRGRFNPGDDHLYVCGMSAWATNQVYDPGGFYRIRYNGAPVYAPIELSAMKNGLRIKFSDPLDPEAVENPDNFTIRTWELKRTRKYGSKHYNEKELIVKSVKLALDARTVFIEIEGIEPVWQMEINWKIKGKNGNPVEGQLQNTIYELGDHFSIASGTEFVRQLTLSSD
ncbi:MAG: hypothetical protein KDD99_24885, partial [Bacteroidetes bacterium]|nr:hypothetical protein [Bacteroidota bacterium]